MLRYVLNKKKKTKMTTLLTWGKDNLTLKISSQTDVASHHQCQANINISLMGISRGPITDTHYKCNHNLLHHVV